MPLCDLVTVSGLMSAVMLQKKACRRSCTQDHILFLIVLFFILFDFTFTLSMILRMCDRTFDNDQPVLCYRGID